MSFRSRHSLIREQRNEQGCFDLQYVKYGIGLVWHWSISVGGSSSSGWIQSWTCSFGGRRQEPNCVNQRPYISSTLSIDISWTILPYNFDIKINLYWDIPLPAPISESTLMVARNGRSMTSGLTSGLTSFSGETNIALVRHGSFLHSPRWSQGRGRHFLSLVK